MKWVCYILLYELKVDIDQKYSVGIVNVVNYYCSWKRADFLMAYLRRPTEAFYQQPSLLCSNGTLLANPS
jgi:hypothetical protein